ncbi:hypothetical protein NLI96_g2477 [Meripilus lineatus]|uniref:Uncharacterized protein n=1 Tax=Meripilus lineatus TaxID=2056292 RepID=A0AAD5V8K1_9APHY|nr:hypothetical protein NLI96_g2477 [Physisporinus lineatus]
MSEVVIYPSVYESGRKWLVIHSLYAVVTSFAAALDPELVFGAMGPLLVAVEQTTGLPHFAPDTPEARNALVTALAFSIGIGSIYFLYSGPWWHYGGKVMVEGSPM